VTKPSDFDLDAEEILTAAVEILEESGLDAVSMRSVSSRLGVSPVPLYSRIGNKEALLDALADRLLADLAPPSDQGEPWDEYGLRWARELRTRLRRARDSRLILRLGRDAYVEASRPLVETMRRDGFPADAAVQACRLLTWATVGFGTVEGRVAPPGRKRRRGRPGGDPGGVDAVEADTLFDLHIRYVIEGIARDAESDRLNSPTLNRRWSRR
jgi:AcrR family transcriptional regulator